MFTNTYPCPCRFCANFVDEYDTIHMILDKAELHPTLSKIPFSLVIALQTGSDELITNKKHQLLQATGTSHCYRFPLCTVG